MEAKVYLHTFPRSRLITGGADAGIKGNGAAGPVHTVSKEPAATKLTRLGWRWTRSGVSKKNGIERVD